MPESGLLHRRSIRVRLADLPGSLHRLTGLVAEAGVNIVRLEIVSRESPDVWDDIELVAPSQSQLDGLISVLKGEGLTVVGLPASWSIRDWAVDVLHALEELGRVAEPRQAVDRFAATAARLANVDHAFVLMEPARPNAAAAEARWSLIREAAEAFDPDGVKWSGDPVGIVVSAMKAARPSDLTSRDSASPPVGAVVRIPVHARRPAHLVVVGRRPMFLAPELSRLELFAQVAAPHLWAIPERVSA